MKPERDKFLTPDQFRRLLAAARGTGQRQYRDRNYLLLALAGNMGLRVSEAVALTVEDFHFDAQPPFVRVGTLKQREASPVYSDLPLDKKLAAFVKGYIKHRIGFARPAGEPPRPLFQVQDGTQLSARMAQHLFKQAAGAAGLLDRHSTMSFHSLRHMRALLLFRATDNLPTVQHFMRWASPATAAKYSHMDPEKEAEVNARVGAIL